ncbi:PAQR family membrane homeostasis protein TrhA [Thiolapillus sp.]|uniref:PAQR family membrane homeostasis protein TrhA n=2 Tax=Thiolapillus sp. TaxID=2017437 RepID=UPI0025FB462E|nr:hemolysin III family protein [Thiolapillus sp.]
MNQPRENNRMDNQTWVAEYSIGEEIAHAITHGIGIPLSIAALVLLVTFSALYGSVWHVTSTAIYGSTLVLVYTASTLYHGIPHERAKPLLQKFDHAAIFLFIAGSYTPFTLVTLQGPWGWTLFGMVWAIAVFGVYAKLAGSERMQRWSLPLYLGMGWMVLFAIKPLVANLDTAGLVLLAAGGLSYTLGALIYAWERLRWNHAIWHLFVLAGSTLQFFSIFFYVVPGSS